MAQVVEVVEVVVAAIVTEKCIVEDKKNKNIFARSYTNFGVAILGK